MNFDKNSGHFSKVNNIFKTNLPKVEIIQWINQENSTNQVDDLDFWQVKSLTLIKYVS